VQVVRLPVIDAHYTKKQLPVQAQREGTASSSLWADDDLDILIDLVLQDLGFGELSVLIGGQPDTSELTRLVQEILGKKHGGGGRICEWSRLKCWGASERCLYRRVGSRKMMRAQYLRAGEVKNGRRRCAQPCQGQ
jgi:hypothetical protein